MSFRQFPPKQIHSLCTSIFHKQIVQHIVPLTRGTNEQMSQLQPQKQQAVSSPAAFLLLLLCSHTHTNKHGATILL